MAVPKRKTSRSRRGKRRSHDALRIPNLSLCPQCSEPKLPHRICPQCGTYRGKVFNKEKSLE
jgi:large subunit ribosomal protein L32